MGHPGPVRLGQRLKSLTGLPLTADDKQQKLQNGKEMASVNLG